MEKLYLSPLARYGSIVDVNYIYSLFRVLSVCLVPYTNVKNRLLNGQHPPRVYEVLKYMPEAIISRRGSKGSGGGELRTDLIQTNQTWTVPSGIKGNLSVRIFGGGGGCCGGGGWMNNGEIALNAGSSVSITIGAGGKNINSGGTTSFGSYLSANGGGAGNGYRGGNGGSGGGWGGTGFQFGGGGGSIYIGSTSGGNGGMWGGGGGGFGPSGYGDGGGNNGSGGIAAGGAVWRDGGAGICILQYYI